MQVGSAQLVAPAGQAEPSGLAIFGYRQNGILISEAGVPAAAPIAKGRIYAEVSGSVNTGIALANSNDSDITVSFFFTDSSGNDFGNGNITIPAHGQIARFLDEAPFSAPRPTNGTLTFSAPVPVSAIAIRGFTNERFEFLVTTLPIVDPSNAVADSTFFPHFVEGGGWSTQFILVNPSDQNISGTLSFFGQGTVSTLAPTLTINIDGTMLNQVTYTIPPRSAATYSTISSSSAAQVGSARVTPALWNATPVGVAIFSFANAGITVSAAGTPSLGVGTAFRMYAEVNSDTRVRTGVAIDNAALADTTVNFELARLDGTSTGLAGTMVLPPSGQRALFLDEIPGFESLQLPFAGVLRLSSANMNITALGLHGRWNERGDFIFTTIPAVNENAPVNSKLVFPDIVDGAGYSTQFILFSGTPSEPASGNLSLFSQSGASLNIGLH
jgi:hypothetical protein